MTGAEQGLPTSATDRAACLALSSPDARKQIFACWPLVSQWCWQWCSQCRNVFCITMLMPQCSSWTCKVVRPSKTMPCHSMRSAWGHHQHHASPMQTASCKHYGTNNTRWKAQHRLPERSRWFNQWQRAQAAASGAAGHQSAGTNKVLKFVLDQFLPLGLLTGMAMG